MARLGRKVVVATAAAITVLAAPSAAWADHCVNLSRGAGNATPWETERGRWFYIEPDLGAFWVMDTPRDALLEDSAACNGARLTAQTGGELSIDTLDGIWSESCVEAAIADAGWTP